MVTEGAGGSARRPRRYGGRGRGWGGNTISSGTQCTLVKRPGGGGQNCFSEQECGQVGGAEFVVTGDLMRMVPAGVQHSEPAAVCHRVGAAVQPGEPPPVLHCPGAAVHQCPQPGQ